jgi:rare lipoprotein A
MSIDCAGRSRVGVEANHVPEASLVPAFRSSCAIAARAFTNFGKLWPPANLLIPVPLYRSEVPDRTRGLWCRDFRSAVLVSGARSRPILRIGAVVLVAASLAACAQSSAVRNSAFTGSGQQAWSRRDQTAPFGNIGRVASSRRHTPFRHHQASPTQIASRGVASFYTEDQETASGEKFDTHALTAAHPSLPFGTRLRVTNVSTGRSVTVRINDRGPYVAGRVVDLSESAASALGMVESGIAKVKLDVVR